MLQKNKIIFFVIAIVSSCLLISRITIAQLSTPRLVLDSFRPIRFNIIRHRTESQGDNDVNDTNNSNNQNDKSTSKKSLDPIDHKRDGTKSSLARNKDPYKGSFSEPAPRHAKLEHVFNTLDRLAYTISKPTVVLNAMRMFTMVMSSLFMSIFMIPVNNNQNSNNHLHGHSRISTSTSNNNYDHQHHEHHYSATRRRGKAIWNNILDQLNRSDVEGMIELITRNYDETFERAGIIEKLLCKERYRRNRR